MMANAQQKALWNQYRHSQVTIALIVVCVVVYLIEVVVNGFHFEISSLTLAEMGAMYAPWVNSPTDWYRFITPMFLHVNVMHLLFNMAALMSVGVLLERILGKPSFLALYFISGISGNMTSFALDCLMGDYSVSAGASTSVFGLFLGAALLGVLVVDNRSFYADLSKGMLGVIVVNVVYTLIIPDISWAGHFGGAIGGAIGMFMVPCPVLRVNAGVRAGVSLAWLAICVAVLVRFCPLAV